MSDARASRFGAVRALTKARLKIFFREPGTMFWTFGFPVVLSIVLGIAFRSRGAEPVVIAVELTAGASEARARSAHELLSQAPDVRPKLLAPAPAAQALRTGKVSLVVTPSADGGFAYRFDPTRPESRLARARTDDVLQRARGRADAFTPAERQVTEPGSRYIDFLIPGLLGLGLMSTGLWGIGLALAEMRTNRLLKRFVATPMRRSDLLASFLIVRAMLLVVELPPFLIFSRFVFGVGIEGSVVLLVLVAALGALTFAVLGLLVASRFENAQMVSGLINVISFPMYLCSGIFFSTARFPDGVQPFVQMLPLTALNDALRAVMIDGAGPREIGGELGIVAAWGAGSFLLAVKLFKWR
ncbi:MAG: ABC transporter permease [Polyangiaceae bacterium]